MGNRLNGRHRDFETLIMARRNVQTARGTSLATFGTTLRTTLQIASVALFCATVTNAEQPTQVTQVTQATDKARSARVATEVKNATKKAATTAKVAAKQPAVQIDLAEARRRAAKRAIATANAPMTPAPYADTYTPAYAPLATHANATLRARASTIEISGVSRRPAAATSSFTQTQSTYSVIVTPTSIDAHVLRNIYEPIAAPNIEMGDRPARGTSLCGDGRLRRFGDIDMKAFAQTLPDFNVARPRTVCVRRGVLMADYFFK
jgi:hypothetical protein